MSLDAFIRPAVMGPDGRYYCGGHGDRAVVEADGTVAIPAQRVTVTVKGGIALLGWTTDGRAARRRRCHIRGQGFTRTYEHSVIRCAPEEACLSRVDAPVSVTRLR